MHTCPSAITTRSCNRVAANVARFLGICKQKISRNLFQTVLNATENEDIYIGFLKQISVQVVVYWTTESGLHETLQKSSRKLFNTEAGAMWQNKECEDTRNAFGLATAMM